MAPDLQPNSKATADAEDGAVAIESTYRVSPAPVIPERSESQTELNEQTAPRSYGSETLCLMARDPHSLFAYWDIDWSAAFGEDNPRKRTVYLRLLNADGSEHSSQEVEPLAGSCNVAVDTADASYQGEIGFFDSLGVWNVLSRSETVLVPAAMEDNSVAADFATVPFHLSFQRMIDALDVAREENESLTAMLAELRQRVTSAADDSLSSQQRDLVRAIEQEAASEPLDSRDAGSPDLWAHHKLESILGFGNSSLSRGFGGSSRH